MNETMGENLNESATESASANATESASESVSVENAVGNALGHLAARLKEDLSELILADKGLEASKTRRLIPEKERKLAYAARSRARMLRMAQNMEACGALLCDPNFAREEPCDLVGLMADICEGAVDLAEMMGIRLTFSCALKEHICAAHTRYLRLCMGNLLCNAMKNVPRGGHVRMIYQHMQTERMSLLSVEDNGAGFSPEDLAKTMEDCWNKPRTLRTPFGAGLGLSICKRVAEGHGGKLTVESAPGKGSKFTVSIPDAPIIGNLGQDYFYEPDGGWHPIMLMLSDALPWEAYTRENLM